MLVVADLVQQRYILKDVDWFLMIYEKKLEFACNGNSAEESI